MGHSPDATLPVTDRMRQAYEAVRQHGTRMAAAEAMGVTDRNVSLLVKAYCNRTGTIEPYRGSKPYALAKRRLNDAEARAAAAEQEAEHLRSEVVALSAELDAAQERITDLEARLAARPIPFVPSHRRVKDGGTLVRQQRREHRRAA